MKYRVEFTALFDIEAENIIQAKKLAEGIRAMGGSAIGFKRFAKNRDWIEYCIKEIVPPLIKVTRK